MRRFVLGLAVAVWLVGAAVPASAHDAYDDSQAHPLRLAAYALNPVGFLLEWTVTRPIHFVVSQPRLERIFGHTPHEYPFGAYDAYNADWQ